MTLKRYILKEYGSWGVTCISFLTGLFAGGAADYRAAMAFIAIALFINSKQALTLWLRSRGVVSKEARAFFLVQAGVGAILMLFVIGRAVPQFLPYAAFPLIYVALFRLAGEHAVLTEVSGFVLLSMSALVARFVSDGRIDTTLYAAVAIFFTAGVFKVRVQLKKKVPERIALALYLIFACDAYYMMKLPLVALLPLADNLLFTLTLYKVRLRIAGWVEVIKGVAFLALMALSYH